MKFRLAQRLLAVLVLVTLCVAQEKTDQVRPVTAGERVERELAGGEMHRYKLNLKAGEFLHAVIEQRGIDVVVALIGPDAKKVLEVDSPNGAQGAEPLFWIAEAPGEYQLEVRSGEKDAALARYEVRVADVRPSTEVDKKRVAAQQALIEATDLAGQRTVKSLQLAIEKSQEALPQWQEAVELERQLLTLKLLGNIHRMLRNNDQAIEYYKKALPLTRQLNDRGEEGVVLNNLGVAYDALSQHENASNYYDQALAIKRELKDRVGEGVVLFNLGTSYQSLSRYDRAIDYLEPALSTFRALQDRTSELETLSYLGIANSFLNRHEKAMEYHEQALSGVREAKSRVAEGNVLYNLGNTLVALGRFEKAIGYLEQSLIIKRDLNDPRMSDLLYQLGVANQELKRYQKAIDFFEQALTIVRQLKDRAGELKTLNQIGSAYVWLNQFDKAIEYNEQALAIVREGQDRGEQVSVLNHVGNLYKLLGQYDKAIAYYDQALTINRAINNRRGEGTSLNNLGGAHLKLRHYEKAIEYYQPALEIWREAKDPASEALAFYNLGQANHLLSRHEKAIEYLELALAIYRETKDRSNEALALGNLGSAHSELSNYYRALDYYEQALAIHRETKDRNGEAKTLNNLGYAYSNVSHFDKALDSYGQALVMFRELKNLELEGTALNNLGSVYQSVGQYQKSIEYREQALRIRREAKDHDGEAGTLNNLGHAYGVLGQYARSIEYFAAALAIFRKVKNLDAEGSTLNNLGVAHDYLQKHDQAIEYFEQALAIQRQTKNRDAQATTLIGLGVASSLKGNHRKAIEYLEQALTIKREVNNRADEGQGLINLGHVYSSVNENEKAIQYYAEGLAITREVGDPVGEADGLDKLMFIRSAQRPLLAILFGKQAVNIYQKIRGDIGALDKESQKGFLKTRENTYRQLAGLLIAQGRLAEGQQTLNLFKDQQFFDFNRDAKTQPTLLTLTPREASTLQRYEQITDRLGTGARKVDELKRRMGTSRPTPAEIAQLKQSEEELKTAVDEFKAFLKQLENDFAPADSDKDKIVETADTRELQTALRELGQQTGQRAVAVYTLVNQKNFRALVITPDTITAAAQPLEGYVLDERAKQLWGLLQPDKYDPKPLAQELYSIVFKPIEALLPKDTNTILWSLDGNLRYVPMAALHDGKQYLVERYNHVVFTRADRERLLRAVSPRWSGLGLGSSEAHTVEVLGDKISFSALPGVREELRALFRRKGFTGGVLEGEVLPDAGFTRAAMLAALKQRRPLVHISSHFAFRPGDEARSFLLLGDGTAMTLAEMKQEVDLFAGVELLTLSACNTAAQQAGASGREIDGFAELAQRLGAGSVMATLWPVADNSTPWLMREFYESRQSGEGLSKAEAFRRAQLALLNGTAQTKPLPAAQKGAGSTVEIVIGGDGGKRDGTSTRADIVYVAAKDAPSFKRDPGKPFAHPYYWAPFILIGNWK